MSRLSLRIIAVVIGLTTSLSIASAQTRVELLTRETIPGVDGLQMLTIRDNQLSVCYMIQAPTTSIDSTGITDENVVMLIIRPPPDTVAPRPLV